MYFYKRVIQNVKIRLFVNDFGQCNYIKEEGGFLFLHCLNSFKSKTEFDSDENFYRNYDYCQIVFINEKMGTAIYKYIIMIK